MELQEAINHAREVAEGCAAGNKECAYQHDKLADWLEELKAVKAILGDDYELDRLRELWEADRDKRCVIFKFGIGSTVYRVWVRPDGSHPFMSEENMSTVNDLVNAESWKDSYATSEAAEAEVAALKRRFADGQGTQKR